MNKNIIYVLIVILIVVGVFFFTNKTEPAIAPAEEDTEIESVTEVEQDNSEVTLEENNVEEGKVEEAPKASGFTMAQVAVHNTKEDCWSAINGSVYNLTTWISGHPGGAQAIIGLCGKDGSTAFNGQHGGKAPQEAKLASFRIGALIN